MTIFSSYEEILYELAAGNVKKKRNLINSCLGIVEETEF